MAFQYQNTHETSAPIVVVGVLEEHDAFTPYTLIEPGNRASRTLGRPFFFQDNRFAFYVETTLPNVTISHARLRARGESGEQPLEIPALEFEQAPNLTRIPGTFVPLSIEPPPGVAAPPPIERFVPQGVTIHISTSAAVQYDGREIGPGGGLFNGSIS